MASAHNDQTATLLEAMTEVVQKLEDSRLGVGYAYYSFVETSIASLTFIGGSTTVHTGRR